MIVVGVRELKNRLSEYLRRVRAGDEVLVTDRGQVVAELHPPARFAPGARIEPGLAALARAGSLRLGAPNDPKLYRRLPPVLSTTASRQLLDAERGEH